MNSEHPREDGARMVTLDIDHARVAVPDGISVLRAAELGGMLIPSLCSHKDLSPFGGCRLCAVEIEGMRGYPMACSTVARDGMKVLTNTVALREMRQEFLQLILSEHPCSCLLCGERDECRRSQFTIRKAGVSTGCRSCSNDGNCELQRVVEQVGLPEMRYPVLYRGFEPEHDDPFFDRDYNLCILCGRCVRMCHEVRGTSVLAFVNRGTRTHVGPAYGRSHVEAGCEFCGACVSVCPTGTLVDKTSKWDGAADGFVTSTCPFCAIGCQVDLHHKAGRLSRVSATLDPDINDGQLCVRGRFCMPEVTHHPDRARKPTLRKGRYFREVVWDEALSEVAGRLREVAPDEFLMVVSSDLTNEGLFAAQRFVRRGLASNGIDSTARAYLPGGFDRWVRLFSLPVSTAALETADGIIVAGLDSRFSFSVAGTRVRRALAHGARLVAVDARESNLARCAAHWLRPAPGDEARLLAHLLQTVASGPSPSGTVAEVIARSEHLAVVLGPRVLECDGSDEVVDALEVLAAKRQLAVLPLCHGTNTRGALELGAFNELLPGPRASDGGGMRLSDVVAGRRRPRVLYLVGESPFVTRPDCDYLVAQDIYMPPFEVDAFLPAASFAEAEGTLTNVEGRVQVVRRVEAFPDSAAAGSMRPDWRIFSDLAGRLDRPELQYETCAAVLEMIHDEVVGFPAVADRQPRRSQVGADVKPSVQTSAGAARPQAPATSPQAESGDELLLVLEQAAFRHRGIDLSGVVEGLSELGLEQALRMNGDDMARLGIAPGAMATISLDGIEVAVPARPDQDCPTGAAYFVHAEAFGGLQNRTRLEPLYRLPAGSMKVHVRPGVQG